MKYRYSGPTSGVTLNVDGKPKEVMLHTGKDVELPESNEYVKTLVALGHLTPDQEQADSESADQPTAAKAAKVTKGA
ncbi:UNVERIFIED_ORG: hypothetical protein HNP28_003726 [Comamonas terrigena]